MKKRKKGLKNFGTYKIGKIMKAQFGVSTSNGFGSGRGYGGMGGGLFGNISTSGVNNGVHGGVGYSVYGEPQVVNYTPVNIDWRRDKIDFSDTYKLLAKLKTPVDISKLFKIDGIDTTHLLPKDQLAFNKISDLMMKKYIEEIRQLSPNLSQGDLMRDDVNFKVNELSMKYKNGIIKLYNELKSNKERVDKNKSTIDDLGKDWGTPNVPLLSTEASKHYEVLANSSFLNYLKKHGDNWANAVIQDLEMAGTLPELERLGDIYATQKPNLSQNIRTNFTSNLTNDDVGTIRALNNFAFEVKSVSQLPLSKIENLAEKSLGAILANKENATEMNIDASSILNSVINTNTYLNGLRGQINAGNLKDVASGLSDIANDEKLRKFINNVKEKDPKEITEEEKQNLQMAYQVLNAYMLTNKQRDVKLLKKKVYVSKEDYEKVKGLNGVETGEEDGKYYWTKEEAYPVFLSKNGNHLTKTEYEIKYKEGDKEVTKVVDEEEYKDMVKNKKDISIVSKAERPITLDDVELKDIDVFLNAMKDIEDLSNDNVGKNVAMFSVYNRMVQDAASKLNISQKIDVRLRDATNVSVSQNNGKGFGGGEIQEGKLPEWQSLMSDLLGSVKMGNGKTFMSFINKHISSQGLVSVPYEDEFVEKGKKEGMVFGVLVPGYANAAIGREFENAQSMMKYTYYDMETGKKDQNISSTLQSLTDDKIGKIHKEFGYAFKDKNGNLILGGLPNDIFKDGKLKNYLGTNLGEIKKNSPLNLLKQSIEWASKNGIDHFKEIFGVENSNIEDAKKKQEGGNPQDAIYSLIGKKLDELNNDEERRSLLYKLMFAYASKNANILVGTFANIEGKKYFIEHSDPAAIGSLSVIYSGTPNEYDFLTRYKYVQPLIAIAEKLNEHNPKDMTTIANNARVEMSKNLKDDLDKERNAKNDNKGNYFGISDIDILTSDQYPYKRNIEAANKLLSEKNPNEFTENDKTTLIAALGILEHIRYLSPSFFNKEKERLKEAGYDIEKIGIIKEKLKQNKNLK